MAKLIEKNSNYAFTIERIKNITFSKLRSVVIDFTKRLPADLNNELYEAIQHGVCQLQSEPELNMYIHALGLMHEAKLQYAFEHLSNDFTVHPTIDIIDYGCGQAIGTICYADFIRNKGIIQTVRKITLIEPSEVALKRAALHVSCFFPDAEIITILKDFDSLDKSDIRIDNEVPTLNILSNVIDLADNYYNLEKFTKLINDCIAGENQFVCIGPYFDHNELDGKIQRFVNLLGLKTYYSKTFTKGTFVEGHDWTCQVVICNTNSQGFNESGALLENHNIFSLRKAAEQGYATAQCNLGYCYQYGQGVDKDETEAVKWYRKAAEQGYATAQCNLGYCYKYGHGVDKDETEAVKWYRKAAEQSYARAQCNLGYCYDHGQGVDKDETEAVKWYRKAAEQGYARAQFILGCCYRDGNGVYKNDNEAIKWYIKAANQGCQSSTNELTKIKYIAETVDGEKRLHFYMLDNEWLIKKYKTHIDWTTKAAQQGYPDAAYLLGKFYYNIQMYDKAVIWYRKAAERDNANAQYRLGVCYDYGRGIPKDESEAIKWYRKAAEQGLSVAQQSIANCYKNGIGMETDYDEAIKWYIKAAQKNNKEEEGEYLLKHCGGKCSNDWIETIAEKGYANIQYMLGNNYRQGDRVQQSYEKAAFWYKKAIENGCVEAQVSLGDLYEHGNGVEQSSTEALKWYLKAAEQDNEKAKYNIARLYALGLGVEQSTEEAINWLNKYKYTGYGLYSLGKLFYDGNGVRQSYEDAIKWWNLAATANYTEAKYMLGVCYEKGDGIQQSYEEAIKWWEIAIKEGSSNALVSLGLLYEQGKGVKQSYKEAARLFYDATNKSKNSQAMLYLGNYFRYGLGVKRSYNEAVKWYKMAAERYNLEAKKNLEMLYDYDGYNLLNKILFKLHILK